MPHADSSRTRPLKTPLEHFEDGAVVTVQQWRSQQETSLEKA